MQRIPLSPTENVVHAWLRQINVSFVPAVMTPLLEQAAAHLLDTFRTLGHTVQGHPDEHTDLLLTTAPFAQPLNWRSSLLFTARRRFGLSHSPLSVTLIHARPTEFQNLLMHFEAALNNMSEGLCMFDASTRLVLCNERYIEMYRLDPELATPGALLRELLEQRKRSGTFSPWGDC